MPPLLQLQKLPGKGDQGSKKEKKKEKKKREREKEEEQLSLCLFCLTRISRVRGGGGGGGGVFWGILWHEQQVIACCQTHSDYGPPKMPLKLAM